MNKSINVGDELEAKIWVTASYFTPFPFRTLWVGEGNQNLTEVGILNFLTNERGRGMPYINRHYSYIMRHPMCYIFKKGASVWVAR